MQQSATAITTDGDSGAVTGRVVARNAAWRFAEAVGGEGVSLIVFVMMARVLAPDHFGVVALAGVFISCAQVLLQQGLPEALIQGEEARPSRLATAFWCNLALGLALAVLIILFAVPAAAVFAEPMLAPVLVSLAVVLPIGAAAAILQARFLRRMAFHVVAIRVLIANIVGGVVGLSLAAADAGLWALVGLQLAQMSAGLVIVALADRWRPRLVIQRREASSLLRFALPVMASHLARFAGKRLDLAILAVFVSATSLGHYFLATRLMIALGYATHYTIAVVCLPVLARLKADPVALRHAVAQTLWLAAALCFPAGIGLALLAEPLVILLFGMPWAASIPPLQVMAALGIFFALGVVIGQVLVAAGRPALFFRLTVTNTAGFLAAVSLAAPWGMVAAALAGGLANALMLPIYLAALSHSIGLDLRRMLVEQLPIYAAAALMAGLVVSADLLLATNVAEWQRLLLGTAVGILGYFSALWLLAGVALRQLIRTLSRGAEGLDEAREGAAAHVRT